VLPKRTDRKTRPEQLKRLSLRSDTPFEPRRPSSGDSQHRPTRSRTLERDRGRGSYRPVEYGRMRPGLRLKAFDPMILFLEQTRCGAVGAGIWWNQANSLRSKRDYDKMLDELLGPLRAGVKNEQTNRADPPRSSTIEGPYEDRSLAILQGFNSYNAAKNKSRMRKSKPMVGMSNTRRGFLKYRPPKTGLNQAQRWTDRRKPGKL